MIEDLFELERLAYGTSPIHRLDARVKLLVTFGAIIALVAYPVHSSIYHVSLIFALLLGLLLAISRVPLRSFIKRVLVILPFGLSILLFQLLFPPVAFPTTTVLADLPFGLTLTAEALSKASMIGVRFVLCIGFIVLLSSTTRIQDLLVGARRLGFPSEFTLILGMMTRYLFVFGQLFLRVRNALSTRCFDPFDRSLPYRYRIRQLGNTIGMVFIRSYEQGERTYMAMLCRGYGKEAFLFVPKKPLARSEWGALLACMVVVIGCPLAIHTLSV
ncbi:MAG TPA: cobalt ECF transporter T component CbiQ [Methanoregulaceae archaeon]|nr:cobalt ECF transporter T component CbiQ [Methanoregulaceae archaeon]